MKRFEFKVILHIIVIFLLSISSCLLYQRQLWFSTTVCILLLIGVGIHLYRIQFKQIALLRQLTDGLRYNDITQNLHPPFKNKMMDEWAQELSNALKDFRGKLLAEEIKHQYYENLLNKVDTAVLVTDVTGHIEWMNQAAVTHLGQLSQLPEVLQELLPVMTYPLFASSKMASFWKWQFPAPHLSHKVRSPHKAKSNG